MFSSNNIITLLPSEVKSYHSSSFNVLLTQGNSYEGDIGRYLASQGILSWNKEQYYPEYCLDAKRTQEDTTILNLNNGLEMVIDIKGRSRLSEYFNIGVGEVKKYIHRTYKTRAVVVVDRESHDILCTDYDPSKWLVEDYGHGASYAVPRHLFYSLETLIERLKNEGYAPDIEQCYIFDILDVLEQEARLDRYLDEIMYDQEAEEEHQKRLQASW